MLSRLIAHSREARWSVPSTQASISHNWYESRTNITSRGNCDKKNKQKNRIGDAHEEANQGDMRSSTNASLFLFWCLIELRLSICRMCCCLSIAKIDFDAYMKLKLTPRTRIQWWIWESLFLRSFAGLMRRWTPHETWWDHVVSGRTLLHNLLFTNDCSFCV